MVKTTGGGCRMKRTNHIGNSGRFVLLAAVLATVVCMAAFVYFRSDSMSGNDVVMGAEYDIKKVLYAVTVGDEISTEPPAQYCVSADARLYDKQAEDGEWNLLGELSSYALTNDELYGYMPAEELRRKVKIQPITASYILRVKEDSFYLVFQTKDGKIYLAYGWEDAKERGQTGLGDTRLRRLYQLERR